jgi:hypothetical protein
MHNVKKSVSFLAAILLGAAGAGATTTTTPVKVDLGIGAQGVGEVGVGNNGLGDGQWFITFGSSSFNGTDTTDTLSGSYTGTTPGFTGGTYSLQTTYVGNIPSPVEVVATTPGGDIFSLESIPSTATINLDLTQTGSSTVNVEPILAKSDFLTGAGFDVFYTAGSYVTTVTPATDVEVGATPGATGSGLVTGNAEFDVVTTTGTGGTGGTGGGGSTAVPLPPAAMTGSVMLAALVGFRALSRKFKTA